MRIKLFILLCICVFLSIFVPKLIKIDENRYNTIKEQYSAYLPGSLRPSDLDCYDAIIFDYMTYESDAHFFCRHSSGVVYGQNNIITGLSLSLQTPLLFGELVEVNGRQMLRYRDSKGVTWIWPNCIARTREQSLDMFSPVTELYLYDETL